MNIPFVDLKAQYLRSESDINTAIKEVLNHGRFILGPEVKEFEAALASYTGSAYVITCGNGTDALTIALLAENIGPGDAVFIPSFTFTATAEVVLLVGATPVFVDVREDDFLINLVSLEQAIKKIKTEGRLTPKAIIPVDLFGLPADYNQLSEISKRYNLQVISDAAQSLGGKVDDYFVGNLAPVTTTSFFPAKPLGCYGDGGALLTNDERRANLYHSLRAHGTGGEKYDVLRMGLNSRLDTLQAAILLVKLVSFEKEINSRNKVAKHYDSLLGKHLKIPKSFSEKRSAWAQYTIQCADRDALKASLQKQGVPTAVYYPRPMHLQTAYRKYGDGDGSLPVSEKLSKEVLSLPIYPYMQTSIVDYICEVILKGD